MVRILLLIMTLVFAFSASAEAGWLDDKLKQAAESVGDRMIDDASDSAYEGTKQGSKDAMGSENDTASDPSGQYDSEKAAEVEEQAEDSAEYPAEYGREEMGQPSWADSNYGQKKKKKKKTGPPRTDLHLSTDMIMSDPENSPEPFKGKVYIDGVRSRTEFKYSDGNNAGIIVTGSDPTDKVYILMHSNKQYMESTYSETDSIVFESGKPCDGYRKAEDLGKTKLNGRSVVKWRCAEPEDPDDYEDAERIVTLWVDDKLEIPIRVEEGNGKGYWELQNILEGKPSGDLFKVPAGYKKLETGTMVIPAAGSLSDQDEKLIKNAGIPLYSKARFVYGNSSVGYRFASSEPVQAVQLWYRAKLSTWPVMDQYGSWIIYNGKPGAGLGEIMSKPQVTVQINDKLPEWHSLDKNMTTEIVIMIPQ